MKHPTVHVTDDPGPVAGRLVREALAARTAHTGRARIGLSGGSSPAPVFDWLRDNLRPEIYPSLWVTWVDERHLPVASGGGPKGYDQRSNIRLAYEHWLGAAPRNPACILPMVKGGSLDEDLAAFRADFEHEFGNHLDVILLGAGPDGHIASLFPGRREIDAPGKALAVRGAPKPPPDRLTLTLPVLQGVDRAVLVAKGAGKADMLAAAYGGDTSLPLGRYRPQGSWHWVLDSAAAAALPESATEQA
jgi:6-phosphogluconolactonase